MMFKRLLLLFGLIGLVVASPLRVTMCSGYQSSWIEDDFEWGVDTDSVATSGGDLVWTVSTPGTCYAQITTDEAHGGSHGVEIHKDATNWPYAQTPLGAVSESYRLSVWLLQAAGADLGGISVTHGDGVGRVSFGLGTAGVVYYYDWAGSYRSTATYTTPGTWVLVEIEDIDFEAYTYDLWVSNALVADDLTMQASATAAGTFRISPTTGQKSVWFDDVSIDVVIPGSAYEVAVENGYEGSETEWLQSLIGSASKQDEQGEAGLAGSWDWESVEMQSALLAIISLVLFVIGMRYRSALVFLAAALGFVGLGLIGQDPWVQIVGAVMALVSGLMLVLVGLRART